MDIFSSWMSNYSCQGRGSNWVLPSSKVWQCTMLFTIFSQCNCQKSNNFFFSTISVMSLPRTNCNNFFFLLFRQYHCYKPIATIFFSSYFSNAIVTNQWPLFFFLRNDMCTPFLQQILNGSLLLVVIVGLKK